MIENWLAPLVAWFGFSSFGYFLLAVIVILLILVLLRG